MVVELPPLCRPQCLVPIASVALTCGTPPNRARLRLWHVTAYWVHNMKLDNFYTQLFFCTARIEVQLSAKESSVGTGFLIKVPVDGDRAAILLVSNRHVLLAGGTTANLTFHKGEGSGDAVRPKLVEVETCQLNVATEVTPHPDPDVDLACANVSGIGNPSLSLFYKHLQPEMLASFDEPWLGPFTEVCFIGYPDGRHDACHHLPILRSGRIASIPSTDFSGARQIVIDAHVHRGSSGSPVFAIPPPFSGGTARFIGVLTQTMIRGEQLVTAAAVPGVVVPLTIGLGLVLKPSLVKELIATALAKIAPAMLPPPANDDTPPISSVA